MFFSQKKLGRPYLANPQFGCSDPREKKGLEALQLTLDDDGKYHNSFYLVMWLYERRCTTRWFFQLYFMFVPTEQR